MIIIDRTGHAYPLRMGDNVVGRGVQCDVRLESSLVSRRHALIHWDGQSATIADLGSTNGVLLNGQRLAPHQPYPLAVGDRLELGSPADRLDVRLSEREPAVQPALPIVSPAPGVLPHPFPDQPKEQQDSQPHATPARAVRARPPASPESLPFDHSLAVVIGIDAYGGGIPKLTTPVSDATRLGDLLGDQHGYEVIRLTEDVTRERLAKLFRETLPHQLGEDDRLLVYFAGHGVALDGDDGPAGHLIPQDARLGDRTTYLAMSDLHGWLSSLPCRHMLAILDCCFAGAFQWAATRQLGALPEVLHKERYDRFIQSPAWQVLTSAAFDQTAVDVLAGDAKRGALADGDGPHSPFAQALFEALEGAADIVPKAQGDGVITATELYVYLRDRVEPLVDEQAQHEQTPGLWPLKKHRRGEYIFLTRQPELPPAPELSPANNPYRGLQSYDEQHRLLFFGREDEISALIQRVTSSPFTAVLGASGTGKSSLVKAGLAPALGGSMSVEMAASPAGADAAACAWVVLPPMRPTAQPVRELAQRLAPYLTPWGAAVDAGRWQADLQGLAAAVGIWRKAHPGQLLLLIVDQLEELVTLCRDDGERRQFLALLAEALRQHPDALRLVVTLRTDFEPQLAQEGSPLAGVWAAGRTIVPPMDQADLRQVIEGPAGQRVLYFDPPELVDTLINEVIQTPGALPLLSFTLSELYLAYVRSGRDDRALRQADYEALGGVIGSLRNRATEEFNRLPGDAHRLTMQRVMLRLVSAEGGEAARRRASRGELVYPDAAENARVEDVLQRLVEARLLVTGDENGRAYVEPAHDALVLAWDKLLAWKREAEEILPLQRRLWQSASEWQEAPPDRKPGLLWDDDPRLPQVEDTLWPASRTRKGLRGRAVRARQVLAPKAKAPPDSKWLNRTELDFVLASVTRRAQSMRRIIGITAAVMVVLAGLALFAGRQAAEATRQRDSAVKAQNTAVAEVVLRSTAEAGAKLSAQAEATAAADARQQQAEAEREARRSRAGELTVLAENALATNPDLALLLAKRAVETTFEVDRSVEPRAGAVLYRALASPFEHAIAREETLQIITDFQGALVDPTGTRIVPVGSAASLWDASGHFLAELGGTVAGFSSDGNLLATVEWVETSSDSSGDLVRVWDRDGNLVTEIQPPFRWVNVALFSPDSGELLVAGNEQDSASVPILLWDVATNERRDIGSSSPGIYQAVFNPRDPQRLVVSTRTRAELWDTSLGRIQSLTRDGDPGDEIASIAFDVTGDHILTTTKGGKARLWDSAGRYQRDLGAGDETITSAGFNPDGQSILVLSSEDRARIEDVGGGKAVTLSPVGADIGGLAFGPDGGSLVGATSDGRVGLWDLEGNLMASAEGNLVDVSPGGDQFLAAGLMQKDPVQVWSRAGELLAEFQAHSGSLISVDYSPDGQAIITSGCDSVTQFRGCSRATTRIWSLSNLLRASSTPRANDSGSVPAVFPDPGGSRILISTQEGVQRATLWDAEGQKEVDLPLVTTSTRWLGSSREGAKAIGLSCRHGSKPTKYSTWCDSPELVEVTFDDGQVTRETPLRDGVDDLRSILISNSGAYLISDSAPEAPAESTSPFTRWIWNTVEDSWHPIEGAEGWGAFSPDETRLAMVNEAGILRLWDVAGQLILTSTLNLEFDTPSFESLFEFSPDGRRLAVSFCTDIRMASCDDATVWMWNLDLNSTKVISASFGSVSALAFGPDSKTIAIANSDDDSVQVWDVDAPSGRDLRQGPKGASVFTEKVSFSPDGKMLATIGGEGYQFWDLQGNLLAAVRAYPDGIDDAQFTADGQSLVTIGCNHRDDDSFECLDTQAKIWRVFNTTEALLAEAERRLGDREFTPSECQDYLGTEGCSP